MGVEEANHGGHTSEFGCHDPFEYLGQCLEKKNNPKGGGGVIGGLSRFVKNHAICLFER